MKKNNLRRKEKVLITGRTGVQKTMTCVEIAGAVAGVGGKVLYVDTEYGSQRYLEELDDKVLENIDLVVPKTFTGLKFAIKKLAVGDFDENHLSIAVDKGWIEFCTVGKVDSYDLLVLDPFDPVKEARLEAKEKFLRQGYYYIGEKKVSIENKDTFGLRGYMYQIPSEWIDELYRFMVRSPYHFVHVVMLPNDKIENYYGWYDAIFEFMRTGDDFEAKVLKLRGKPVSGNVKVEVLRSKLAEKFVEVLKISKGGG